MINMITGAATLVLAGVLYLLYKPKAKNSLVLCAMTGAMGFIALSAGTGNWKFQLIQVMLQLVVSSCCVLQLHREKVLRARRAARRRMARSIPAPQQEAKSCA